MAKPVYLPTVTEAVAPVERPRVFAAVEAVLGIAAAGDVLVRQVGDLTVTETVISHEAPWRLVLDVEAPSGAFHQESFVAVPHDEGCLVTWSALVAAPVDAAYAAAVAHAVPGRLDAVLRALI